MKSSMSHPLRVLNVGCADHPVSRDGPFCMVRHGETSRKRPPRCGEPESWRLTTPEVSAAGSPFERPGRSPWRPATLEPNDGPNAWRSTIAWREITGGDHAEDHAVLVVR